MTERHDGREAKRVAVIGAGPIGLEAAVYAATLGHQVVVFESGEVGANVRQWEFVRLFSPWSMNTTALGLLAISATGRPAPEPSGLPTGRQLVDRYLLPLSASPALANAIRPRQRVIAVSREDFVKSDQIGTGRREESPFRLLVRGDNEQEAVHTADVVLDCSGVYANHRWAGRGGIPAPGERRTADRIRYTLPDVLGKDRGRYANRHTLVLGCGYSAATVLRDLAELTQTAPATRVTWAIRRPGQAFQAVANDPLLGRQRLVEQILHLADQPPAWLQFLGNCVLEAVGVGDPLPVTLSRDGVDLALTVDEVVALVGYAPDSSLYEQLQIHECYATAGPMKLAAALLGNRSGDCLTAGAAMAADSIRNPEPGFFILGAKSFGTNSNFLMRVGHGQIRDAFRIIENDASLDLYAPSPVAV